MGVCQQGCAYPFHDPIHIFYHLVVPEPNDMKSLALEDLGARSVMVCPAIVLSAIHLDNKTALQTDEIHDVWTNRTLTAELVTLDRTPTQPLPQTPFGIRHVGTKIAGAFEGHRRINCCRPAPAAHPPTPPSPASGGGSQEPSPPIEPPPFIRSPRNFAQYSSRFTISRSKPRSTGR